MYKWIKKELEKNKFKVILPEMPNTKKPEIESWVNKVSEVISNENNFYFIGHSIGRQTILRFIEKSDVKVKGLILIAPWINLNQKTLEEEGEETKEIAKPWIETPIDFKKIKSKANNLVCIFSDNDPYVPLSDLKIFKENLGAKIIIENNKGHFNEAKNQTAVSELLKLKKEKN